MGIYLTNEEVAAFKSRLHEMGEMYADESRSDWFDADDEARAIAETLEEIIEERGAACPASPRQMEEFYALSPEEDEQYQTIIRKRAYWDMRAEFQHGASDGTLDAQPALTCEQVERIIGDYLHRRYSDWAVQDEAEDMRDAIEHITGISL